MKKKTGMEKFKIIAGLLTALLFSAMAAMMYMGGSVSLSSFLQEGNVYDFSRSSLTAETGSWAYDEENECFTLTSKRAIKRLTIDGKESSWGFLYVTIDKLSVPELPAQLRYYDRNQEVAFTQEVTLVPGENVILLNPEILPYRIGFYVRKQKGAMISFASMQMREKERREYAVGSFLTTVIVVYLITLVVWLLAGRLRRKKMGRHDVLLPGPLLEYIYIQMGNLVGGLNGRPEERENRRGAQTLLFILLFFWCISTTAAGWNGDEDLYRYQVLGCMVLLIAAGGFCTGDFHRAVRWNTPVAYFWMLLWVGTMISDFFAGGKLHFYGYGMLLAGGYFIYEWNRMVKPEQMFEIWSDALEIVFFLSVPFSLLFRPKLLAVQYNGVFSNPEENAMFALLLFLTFAVDMERQMQAGGKGIKVFLCFVGMALSAYLVVRAENKAGYVAAGILSAVLLVHAVRNYSVYVGWLRGNFMAFAGFFLVSVFAVAGFHIGIKVIPDGLGTSLEYKSELKQSGKSKEVLDELAAVMPEYVEGITVEADQDPDPETVRRAYVRELSLFGNGNEMRVARKKVSADNEYLFMAYRYGIFILVPFLMYQIAVLQTGAKGILAGKKRDSGRNELWIFGVMVIYIAFCIRGNAQLSFAHPLWLCVYLGSGFWFREQTG